MSDTTQPSDVLRARAIAQGRAMVKLIEGAQVLLTNTGGAWPETVLLKLVLALYQHRLRLSIAVLPADWSEEILAASSAGEAGL
jgi:hypothetical protein